MSSFDVAHWGGSDRISNLEGAVNNMGNSRVPAYVLTSDGSTVNAFRAATLVATGTDAGAVLSAVLPAASSAGAHIDFRNDGNAFPWGSVPALPKGIAKRLRINGNGVTVTLSSGGPRLFDFNKTADYDTFQNLEITDFVVDCNSIGGQHHIVLGTYISGSNIIRLNMDQIAIRRIKVINAPTDSTLTNHRRGIVLSTVHNAAAEGTQTIVKNIVVEDYRQEGGNAAIEIAGSFGGSLATGCNTFVDNIFVNRWYHDTGSVASATFASSNVQIGGRGQLGRCVVSNGYGRGSGDIGVEIDCPRGAVVENVVIEDSFNSALYFGNYTQPANTSENRFTARNVVHRKIASTSATSRLLNGFVNSTVNVPCGDITLDACTAEQHTAEAATTTGSMVNLADTSSAGFRSLTMLNCLLVSDSIATSSSVTCVPVSLTSRTTTCRVTVKNLRMELAGTISGGASFTVRSFQFGNGTFIVDIDGFSYDNTISGNQTNLQTVFGLAISGSATTLQGLIRNLVITSATDTTLTAASVRGTQYLTIPAGRYIEFQNCDLTLAKSAGEFLYVADTAAQTRVFQTNCIYHTTNGQPAPTTLTGLVTATGKVLGTNWPAVVQFVQGSGAAITAIDVSTNGGTTYTNLLTQASGALPAGFDTTIGPLRSDSLIKVTFATTQPTINLYPANI